MLRCIKKLWKRHCIIKIPCKQLIACFAMWEDSSMLDHDLVKVDVWVKES